MERLDFNVDRYDPVEATIHMARYMNARPYIEGKRVIDLACGEGYGSALMLQWGAQSVTGVDISCEAIDAAKALFGRNGPEFLQHDVQELPFPDASFDVAVSMETIEHLDNPERFLRELRRVVRSGGTIIISCPNDNYYSENVQDFDNPYHKRRYSYFDFSEMAERILGKADNWYLGSALAGFYNMPMAESTNPDLGDAEAPENMLGMMDAQKLSDVMRVPASKYLNNWNSVYYVGVWGAQNAGAALGTAAVYPVPHFFLYQNREAPETGKASHELARACRALEADVQALTDKLEAQRAAYDEREEAYRTEAEDRAEAHRVLQNERDRLHLMVDMQKKEELLLWDQIRDLRAKNEQLFQEHLQYFGLQEAYAKRLDEIKALESRIEALTESNRFLEATIGYMENSRGWRLLEKARAVVRRFR